MQMVGSFAEFERAMIRERTHAGLTAARARGRIGGAGPRWDRSSRPPLSTWCTRGGSPRRTWHGYAGGIPATVSRLLAAQRQQQAQARPPEEEYRSPRVLSPAPPPRRSQDPRWQGTNGAVRTRRFLER